MRYFSSSLGPELVLSLRNALHTERYLVVFHSANKSENSCVCGGCWNAVWFVIEWAQMYGKKGRLFCRTLHNRTSSPHPIALRVFYSLTTFCYLNLLSCHLRVELLSPQDKLGTHVKQARLFKSCLCNSLQFIDCVPMQADGLICRVAGLIISG